MEALSSNVMLEKYARKTDRKALAMAMKTETVRVQSTLYKQGASAENLYIIVSGQAKVRNATTRNSISSSLSLADFFLCPSC